MQIHIICNTLIHTSAVIACTAHFIEAIDIPVFHLPELDVIGWGMRSNSCERFSKIGPLLERTQSDFFLQ